MSEALRFFALALVILVFFAVRILLGQSSGSRIVAEWRPQGLRQFFATIERFYLSLAGWRVPVVLGVAPLLVLSAAVWLVFLELTPGSALVPALAALTFALGCLGLMRDFCQWKTQRFEERLVEAVDLMVAVLRVGENPRSALVQVARLMREPVGRECGDVVRRLDQGLELEQAVQRMVSVYDAEGTRLFVQALRAKWGAGGDLAEVLNGVSRSIRERMRTTLQMRGQLSGVAYAGVMLAGMPYALYAFFLLSQPGWVESIHAHALGQQLLHWALGLQVLGLFALLHVLRSDV